MPKHFTAEQFAASAAVGDLRPAHPEVVRGRHAGVAHVPGQGLQHASALHPGEALPPGDASRPDLWKAAAQQRKKIEA